MQIKVINRNFFKWINIRLLVSSYYLFFLFGNIQVNAQLRYVPPNYSGRDFSKMATIDSSKIRVWYAINAENIANPDSFEDLHCLDIGSHISAYYSYFLLRADSLLEDWYKKNRNAQSGPGVGAFDRGKYEPLDWHEYHYSYIFKDLVAGTLTAYSIMPRFIPRFTYVDDAVQKWTLHNETETIAGYLCQKATCTFRGRNFTAWFTTDIPISNGPWKFGGLPGLILKIYDMDNLHVFECTNVQIFRKAYPVKKHEFNNFAEIDRQKFRKLVMDIYENYQKVTGSSWSFSEHNQTYDLWELE